MSPYNKDNLFNLFFSLYPVRKPPFMVGMIKIKLRFLTGRAGLKPHPF